MAGSRLGGEGSSGRGLAHAPKASYDDVMRALVLLVFAPVLSLAGCSTTTTTVCQGYTLLTVGPGAANADHGAAAPANQAKFSASASPGLVPGSCVLPNTVVIPDATWTSNDPVNVSISSADDATNGLATCIGSTPGTAVITATIGTGAGAQTATAALTCR